MLAGFSIVAMGVLLLWVGWRHWRLRNQETINLIEATILRATGEEPLPCTRFDRIFGRVQAVLGFVLGSFFIVGGLAALYVSAT